MPKIRYEIASAPSNPNMSDMPRGSHHYKIRFKLEGRQITTPFSCGPLAGFPKPGEVLECLLSDMMAGERSFEEFCGDFGYDTDSRKAEKTFKVCRRMAPKVRNLLGDLVEKAQEADDPAVFLQNQCLEDESNLGL